MQIVNKSTVRKARKFIDVTVPPCSNCFIEQEEVINICGVYVCASCLESARAKLLDKGFIDG